LIPDTTTIEPVIQAQDPIWKFTLPDGTSYSFEAPDEATAREDLVSYLMAHDTNDVPESAIREQILLDDQGLIAQTFARINLSFGNAGQTPGVIYSTAIALLKGDPIRSILVLCHQGYEAFPPERMQFAILDKVGNKVADSGDVKELFDVAGSPPVNLNFDVTESGLYYCAVLTVGPVVPTFGLSIDGGNAVLSSKALVANRARRWAETPDQTEIPDVVALGDPATNGTGAVWFGVSK
jgi:hypothetical protein